jgi:protein required for attachment to host cells
MPVPTHTPASHLPHLGTPGAHSRARAQTMKTAQTSRSSNTWVVVADEAIARILRWSDSGNALEPVDEITDPDAHASGQDLRRDAYGRRASTGTGAQRLGAGTTASAGQSEQHQEAEVFARRVARHIEQAWHQHRFSGLQIAAAPRFLGLLRQSLDPEVCDALQGDIDKDWVHARNDEIAQHLRDAGLSAPARQQKKKKPA